MAYSTVSHHYVTSKYLRPLNWADPCDPCRPVCLPPPCCPPVPRKPKCKKLYINPCCYGEEYEYKKDCGCGCGGKKQKEKDCGCGCGGKKQKKYCGCEGRKTKQICISTCPEKCCKVIKCCPPEPCNPCIKPWCQYWPYSQSSWKGKFVQ